MFNQAFEQLTFIVVRTVRIIKLCFISLVIIKTVSLLLDFFLGFFPELFKNNALNWLFNFIKIYILAQINYYGPLFIFLLFFFFFFLIIFKPFVNHIRTPWKGFENNALKKKEIEKLVKKKEIFKEKQEDEKENIVLLQESSLNNKYIINWDDVELKKKKKWKMLRAQAAILKKEK